MLAVFESWGVPKVDGTNELSKVERCWIIVDEKPNEGTHLMRSRSGLYREPATVPAELMSLLASFPLLVPSYIFIFAIVLASFLALIVSSVMKKSFGNSFPPGFVCPL